MKQGVYERKWTEPDGRERTRRFVIRNGRVLSLRAAKVRPLSFYESLAGTWVRVGDISVGAASHNAL